MSAVVLPPEVDLRLQKRNGAIRWRLDHARDADRDGLWRCYVTGALWRERLDRDARRAVMAGLDDAKRAVPFSVDEVDTGGGPGVGP